MADSPMTDKESGRIGHLESEVAAIGGQLGGMVAQQHSQAQRMDRLESTAEETAKGMQILLGRQGSTEATRGMFPISYVWSAVSIFVALLGVGLLMLKYSNDDQEDALETQGKQLRTEISLIGERAAAAASAAEQAAATDNIREAEDKVNFQHLVDQLGLHRIKQASSVENQEGRISENEIELGYFWDWYHPFLTDYGALKAEFEEVQRLSQEVLGGDRDTVRRIALLEAKVDKAWAEIRDHEDEADHPIRQTFELKALEDRMNNWNKN